MGKRIEFMCYVNQKILFFRRQVFHILKQKEYKCIILLDLGTHLFVFLLQVFKMRSSWHTGL